MKLTAENVHAAFLRVMFNEDEIVDGKPISFPVLVEGVIGKFGFHEARLEAERENVRAMLSELPDEFKADKGGGMSFLNACMTKGGAQWGEHRNMNELVCLGLGLKLVEFNLPKEMWSMLPGGMPYFMVLA